MRRDTIIGMLTYDEEFCCNSTIICDEIEVENYI